LLVGNHDVSPTSGRAHTLHELDTLSVPHIHVADRIRLLGPEQLGVPVQIITVPWISRNALMAREELANQEPQAVLDVMAEKVGLALEQLLNKADPSLPLILTAHASVQGAKYSSERAVMLGQE